MEQHIDFLKEIDLDQSISIVELEQRLEMTVSSALDPWYKEPSTDYCCSQVGNPN